MHPAKSVIYFTTASGAGYGLMIWLALLAAFGQGPHRLFGVAGFGVAFFLIISGLLSSTAHLGRPERAWRALSQWRSSWLSREGVLAILTFMPAGVFAFFWVVLGVNGGLILVVGLLAAVLSLLTVYTTSMIYASLKTIPAWSNSWTSINYLLMALISGGILALMLLQVFGVEYGAVVPASVVLLCALGAMAKLAYWRTIDVSPARSTAQSATGLGQFGKVHMVESPHSEDNYLLKEMGFSIARKHANALRRVALLCGFVLPMALVAAIGTVGPVMAMALLFVAVLFGAPGLTVERWLFFAEAKHVVTLYYGQSDV